MVQQRETPPMHVLVVDDEFSVRQLLATYLTLDGHTVETAVNGHDGLEKFQTGQFDLVLLDLSIPQINGDKLAAAIKRISAGTPVILLTGFLDHPKSAGVDLVVSKPIGYTEFRQLLSTVSRASNALDPSVWTLSVVF